jgi:hypothetical protein
VLEDLRERAGVSVGAARLRGVHDAALDPLRQGIIHQLGGQTNGPIYTQNHTRIKLLAHFSNYHLTSWCCELAHCQTVLPLRYNIV